MESRPQLLIWHCSLIGWLRAVESRICKGGGGFGLGDEGVVRFGYRRSRLSGAALCYRSGRRGELIRGIRLMERMLQ